MISRSRLRGWSEKPADSPKDPFDVEFKPVPAHEHRTRLQQMMMIEPYCLWSINCEIAQHVVTGQDLATMPVMGRIIANLPLHFFDFEDGIRMHIAQESWPDGRVFVRVSGFNYMAEAQGEDWQPDAEFVRLLQVRYAELACIPKDRLLYDGLSAMAGTPCWLHEESAQ